MPRCLGCKRDTAPADSLHCAECRAGAVRPPADPERADVQPMPLAYQLAPETKEDTVQAAVILRLRALGFDTWRIGQADARDTQDAGPSDVIAIHTSYPVIAFVECKRRERGQWSKEQRAFCAAVRRAGGQYVLPNDPAVIDAWWADLQPRFAAA